MKEQPANSDFSFTRSKISRRKLLAAGGVATSLAFLASCNHNVSNSIDKSKQRAVKRSGLDLSNIDFSVRPQDDLYHYANGQWLKNFQLPSDKASFGTFQQLTENSHKSLHKIIRELLAQGPGDNPDNEHVIKLYKNFTDLEARNNNGFTPLQEEFQKVDSASNKTKLLQHITDLYKRGIPSLFDLTIEQDVYKAEKYSVYISQSGISLPNREYYLTDNFQNIKTGLQQTITKLFSMAGFANPNLAANSIINLETRIAKAQWNPVQLRDVDKNYTNVTFKGLYTNAPKYDWKTWLDSLLRGKQTNPNVTLVMQQPSFISAAAEIWADTDLEVLKNWTKWNIIRARSAYLTEEIDDIAFNFFETTINGIVQKPPLWQRGVELVNSYFGEIIGQLYVKDNFSQADKLAISKLVDNVIAAYRESLTNLEWMSPRTRNAAISKLDKIKVKLGYPEKWKSYQDLKVSNSDIINNINEINLYNYEKQLRKLHQPVDKEEWEMSPATVNAYYNPSKNEIVFPAAILQTPFFDASVDSATNYGGIGAVIGHEIGHGFDDQGSKFDGEGNRKDWWNKDDREKYEKKTQALIKQYNNLIWKEADNRHVNGSLTVGENLADLGGLTISLRAYALELAANNDKISAENKIDNYSDLQRAFLNWGRIWRSKYRKEMAVKLIETDPHAPAEFRANQILKNIEDFYTAFSVKPTDKMYLPSQERVKIW